ncbi:MAG: BatD family protein [Thiotrichales bacterium]|nr:BatD family protein [Thiotrichales bacterium]
MVKPCWWQSLCHVLFGKGMGIKPRLSLRLNLLIGLGLSLVLVNNAQAMVSVSPKKLMLGEPVIVIIKGQNIEADFSRFDKNKIKKHFEIYDVEGGTNFIRLVIYPRKSGKFQFPAMHIGQLQFAGETIDVAPNPDVNIVWKPPRNTAFVGELQSWKALVTTSANDMGVRLLEHPHANNQVTHLFSAQAMGSHSNNANSVTLFGGQRMFQMLIGSDKAGKIKVRTPIIKVQNTGNGRPWLFFDDTQWIHVKPLPSYLPVAMPIGKVSLMPSKLSFWQVENQQLDWELTVKGENLDPNTLPDPTSQFAYNHAVEWLMPDQNKHEQWTESGLISERLIKQPLRFVSLGLIRLPDIRITYFDPVSGKLVDQFISGQWVFSVPRVVYWLMNALFYGLVVFLLLLLLWMFMDAWHKWRLVVAIKQAKNRDEIWQALLIWTVSQFGSEVKNLSFGQWEKKIHRHYGDASSLSQLVRALDKDHFSLDDEDVRSLVLEWAKSLPVFKWQRLRDRVLAFKLKRV